MAQHRNSRQERVAEAARRARKMRIGWYVFLALILIEVGEYLVGITLTKGAWPILAVMAPIGVWPILHYFMHVPQLWRKDEEE